VRGLDFAIDPDVRRAETPPAAFYREPEVHRLQAERVFARSWQLATDEGDVPRPRGSRPLTLLPGCLDEELVATRDGEARAVLSNACTHRGMCVAEQSSAAAGLRCRYHGRRFGLDGAFHSAPGFERALDFPRPEDDLPAFPLERLGPWWFTSLAPESDFERWWAPVEARCGHLPWDRLERDPSRDRAFQVRANWALYVENYLEGLHIPYIHPGLSAALDWTRYRYELFDSGVLQLAEAADGEAAFDPLPSAHPDHGRRVAAWYWWLFPNLMVNVYPFGVSINVVEPRGPLRCEVRFQTYVWDRSRIDSGASGDLNRIELEDEAAVAGVQRGLAGRAYGRGRYAPEHDQGAHHFHRLLMTRLAGSDRTS
jgi:choline monooxygenase